MDRKGTEVSRKINLVFMLSVFVISMAGCQTVPQKSQAAAEGKAAATERTVVTAAKSVFGAFQKADSWVRDKLW